MAEGSGLNVGSIYVDIGADTSGFDEALEKIHAAAESATQLVIKPRIAGFTELTKLLSPDAQGNAAQRILPVTLAVDKKQLGNLQADLKATTFTATISSLTLADGAIGHLREAIIEQMKDFKLPIDVTFTGQAGNLVVAGGAGGRGGRGGGRGRQAPDRDLSGEENALLQRYANISRQRLQSIVGLSQRQYQSWRSQTAELQKAITIEAQGGPHLSRKQRALTGDVMLLEVADEARDRPEVIQQLKDARRLARRKHTAARAARPATATVAPTPASVAADLTPEQRTALTEEMTAAQNELYLLRQEQEDQEKRRTDRYLSHLEAIPSAHNRRTIGTIVRLGTPIAQAMDKQRAREERVAAGTGDFIHYETHGQRQLVEDTAQQIFRQGVNARPSDKVKGVARYGSQASAETVPMGAPIHGPSQLFDETTLNEGNLYREVGGKLEGIKPGRASRGIRPGWSKPGAFSLNYAAIRNAAEYRGNLEEVVSERYGEGEHDLPFGEAYDVGMEAAGRTFTPRFGAPRTETGLAAQGPSGVFAGVPESVGKLDEEFFGSLSGNPEAMQKRLGEEYAKLSKDLRAVPGAGTRGKPGSVTGLRAAADKTLQVGGETDPLKMRLTLLDSYTGALKNLHGMDVPQSGSRRTGFGPVTAGFVTRLVSEQQRRNEITQFGNQPAGGLTGLGAQVGRTEAAIDALTPQIARSDQRKKAAEAALVEQEQPWRQAILEGLGLGAGPDSGKNSDLTEGTERWRGGDRDTFLRGAAHSYVWDRTKSIKSRSADIKAGKPLTMSQAASALMVSLRPQYIENLTQELTGEYDHRLVSARLATKSITEEEDALPVRGTQKKLKQNLAALRKRQGWTQTEGPGQTHAVGGESLAEVEAAKRVKRTQTPEAVVKKQLGIKLAKPDANAVATPRAEDFTSKELEERAEPYRALLGNKELRKNLRGLREGQRGRDDYSQEEWNLLQQYEGMPLRKKPLKAILTQRAAVIRNTIKEERKAARTATAAKPAEQAAVSQQQGDYDWDAQLPEGGEWAGPAKVGKSGRWYRPVVGRPPVWAKGAAMPATAEPVAAALGSATGGQVGASTARAGAESVGPVYKVLVTNFPAWMTGTGGAADGAEPTPGRGKVGEPKLNLNDFPQEALDRLAATNPEIAAALAAMGAAKPAAKPAATPRRRPAKAEAAAKAAATATLAGYWGEPTPGTPADKAPGVRAYGPEPFLERKEAERLRLQEKIADIIPLALKDQPPGKRLTATRTKQLTQEYVEEQANVPGYGKKFSELGPEQKTQVRRDVVLSVEQYRDAEADRIKRQRQDVVNQRSAMRGEALDTVAQNAADDKRKKAEEAAAEAERARVQKLTVTAEGRGMTGMARDTAKQDAINSAVAAAAAAKAKSEADAAAKIKEAEDVFGANVAAGSPATLQAQIEAFVQQSMTPVAATGSTGARQARTPQETRKAAVENFFGAPGGTKKDARERYKSLPVPAQEEFDTLVGSAIDEKKVADADAAATAREAAKAPGSSASLPFNTWARQMNKQYGLDLQPLPTASDSTFEVPQAEIERVVQRQQRERELPNRALGTSVMVGIERMFGPQAGIAERAKLADVAKGKWNAARKEEEITGKRQLGGMEAYGAVRGELTKAIASGAPQDVIDKLKADFKEAGKQAHDLSRAHHVAAKAAEDTGKAYEKAEDAVQGVSDTVKHFGVAFLGSMAGMAVAQVATQVFGHVADAIKEVASPAVERAGGFRTTSYRVGQEIGAATRQNAGRADLATMEMLSQAGIGGGLAANISPALVAMGSARGGVEAYQRQSDILHAAQFARSQSKQYGGYDENLFRNVGGYGIDIGPLHTAIGGSASLQERMVNDLGVLPKFGQQPPGPVVTGMAGNVKPNVQGMEDFAKSLANGQEVLDLYNADVKRASGGMDTLTLSLQGSTKASLAEQQSKFEAAKLGDLGRRLQEQGITVQGLEGLSGTDATKAIRQWASDVATGAEMPDTGLYLERQKALEIPNRYASMGMQRENMRKFGMMNWGFAQAQAPLRSSPLLEAFAAQGRTPTGGGAQTQYTNAAMTAVNQQAASQAEAMKQFTINTLKMGTEEAKNFGLAFDNVLNIGKQISDIQFNLGAKQAALTVAQLNNELRLTNRALTDAKGLAGQPGGSKYGQVQREQWQLGRQSQQIGFQLTERQLNMQEAVIGFGVSGESPQERGARMEEAKLRLKLERQQLAISKKQYGNEGYLFQEGANRSVTDLNAQIALLQQGIQLQIDTEQAGKDIEELQAEMGAAMSQISGPIEQAQSFAGQLVTDLEAFSNAFKVVMKDFVTAFYATWGQGAPGSGVLGGSQVSGLPPGYDSPTSTAMPPGYDAPTSLTQAELKALGLGFEPRSWVPGRQSIASAQGYKPSTALPTPGGAMWDPSAPGIGTYEAGGAKKPPLPPEYRTFGQVGNPADRGRRDTLVGGWTAVGNPLQGAAPTPYDTPTPGYTTFGQSGKPSDRGRKGTLVGGWTAVGNLQQGTTPVSQSTTTTVNVGGLTLSMNVDGASIEDVQKLLNDGAAEIVQKVQAALTQQTRYLNGRGRT